MQKTWLVMCPDWQSANHINKVQGWTLFKNAINNIGTDYFCPKIDCIVCGKQFSLQQGVSEAFASDIVINDFRHNSSESGKVKVALGILENIRFVEPFIDIPEIILNPYLKAADIVSGYVTSQGFAIFSCADYSILGEEREITWNASGNRASSPIPLWRMLLSNSKGQQKRKNFRSEIVELESSFEVFAGQYLGENLKSRLRSGTLAWFLKRSIEEQLNVGFAKITGIPLKKMYPKEYCRWQKQVKEIRNGIVHRGMT